MNRLLAVLATALALFALTNRGADAQSLFKQHGDKRLAAVSLGIGAATTAAYIGINRWHLNGWESSAISAGGAIVGTTIGCMALSPIIGTIVVNRPLTMREADVMFASCIVPFIGGWLVNAAYDAHPEWEKTSARVPAKHHGKRRAKM